MVSCEAFELSAQMLVFIGICVFFLGICLIAMGRAFGQGVGFGLGTMIISWKEEQLRK